VYICTSVFASVIRIAVHWKLWCFWLSCQVPCNLQNVIIHFVRNLAQTSAATSIQSSVVRAGEFNVSAAMPQRFNWAGLGSATLMDPHAAAFESEGESASVVILSGQQCLILWSQKLAASMYIQSCISSFSFNGLSVIPTDGDLGTMRCAEEKFYGVSSVATKGVPLLFVSDSL